MLLFDRYFIKSIFSPLITIGFVLTSVVWVAQIMKLMPLLQGSISIRNFLSLVCFVIPSLVYYISPIISLLAVIYCYNKMKEEQQIVIFQSCGLGNLSIARPAIIMAFGISILTFVISAYIMPISHTMLKERIKYFRDNNFSYMIVPKKFNQISNELTLYFSDIDKSENLTGLVLFDGTNHDSKAIYFAKSGDISIEDGSMSFILSDGVRQGYDAKRNPTFLNFDKLTVLIQNDTKDSDYRKKSDLEMFLSEMLYPDKDLKPDKQTKLVIEGHIRIIWPFFSVIFTSVFLSLFLRYQFSRKLYWKQIMICLIPIFIITFIHFSLQKLSYVNPIFIFAAYLNLAIWMIFSIRGLSSR